jgi:hypothetical protein
MSMDISAQRFKLNEPIIAADVIDGEAIIINLAKGDYFSLASTGADFWKMIVAGYSVDEVVPAAVDHFRIDAAKIDGDLRDLMSRLVAEQLIVPDADGAPHASPPAFSTTSYETPAMSVFTDVRDLLAVDPPLPEYSFNEQK